MTVQLHTLAWKLLSSEKFFQLVDRYSSFPRTLGIGLALDELNQSAAELRVQLDQLPEISQFLERQFLGFQTTLEQLSGASRDLIDHGQSVVRLASGQETGDLSFESVFATLDSPLKYLATAQEAMEELLAGLRNSLDAISRLLNVQRMLEATLAPLHITQVMFRIQSAHLPSEATQVFNAVTEKIEMLQRQVQSAFSEHGRVLAAVHSNLVEVVAALENQMATQGRKAAEKRLAFSEVLSTLLEDINRNAQRDVALTSATQELARLVSGAVMALQMQDIIAQKLAHGSEGIRDTLKALSEIAPARGETRFQTVTTIARIEAAQLDAVLSDLSKCDGALREAFGGISGLLEQLNSDCLMLKEFREITASTNGTVQGLLDSLEEVREMIAATLGTILLAEKSVQSICSATEGLTSTVDGVAHEMRLIALNAQIQAIQRGEGTGLDVLAAHSAEVSQAITTISADIASKVIEVANSVADHSERVRALRQAGQQTQEELALASDLQEAALHRFRDRTLDEFIATGTALDKARDIGDGILSLLDLGGVVAPIERLRDSVRELAQRSEEMGRIFRRRNVTGLGAGDPADPDLPDAELALLQRRYTMASERLVYASASGLDGSAAGSGTVATGVDLWDEDAPEVLAEMQVGEPSGGGEFGDGVELF